MMIMMCTKLRKLQPVVKFIFVLLNAPIVEYSLSYVMFVQNLSTRLKVMSFIVFNFGGFHLILTWSGY